MARANGFSLVELLIALGITTFLVTISATLHLQSMEMMKNTENRTMLTQDAILLIDYLRNEAIGVGGGSVRGWMGVWAEDNCPARSVFPACGGSDRLTLSTIRVPVQECVITGMAGANTLQVAFSSPGVCCMQPQIAGEISFQNRQVFLTLGDFYAQRYVTSVDLTNCRATIQPGQASGGDQTGGTVNWTNGALTLMQIETIYRDPTTNMLKRFMDDDNDGTVDAGEDLILADSVIDFQTAMGYDFNIADGNVVDTPNGVNDEWLFNAPGVAESFGAAWFASPPLLRSQLHLVGVGVILGVSDPTSKVNLSTAQVYNGPQRTVPGWTLQSEVSFVAPRNAFIFQ